MINAAIAGLGWWGKNLVDAVQGKSERLRFIRGVSKQPNDVREFAARHGFALSTDLAEVLADPAVQAVVLATPHSLHVDQIVAAARAGKPVFCEKPLAFRKADAARAIEACRQAGLPLGIGTNKRQFPSMRELKRVVASGELGDILHIEGHSSNENSGTLFAPWRADPRESPAGGMTGPGIHILDALVSLMGPVRRVEAQLVSRKPAPDPHDSVSALLEFADGASGTFATVRATPFYWRVHVFGRKASAEALGETELVMRRSGAPPQTTRFAPVDTLRAELEAFADAVEGRALFPIQPAEMLDVVAAFEAVVRSVETKTAVAAA